MIISRRFFLLLLLLAQQVYATFGYDFTGEHNMDTSDLIALSDALAEIIELETDLDFVAPQKPKKKNTRSYNAKKRKLAQIVQAKKLAAEQNSMQTSEVLLQQAQTPAVQELEPVDTSSDTPLPVDEVQPQEPMAQSNDSTTQALDDQSSAAAVGTADLSTADVATMPLPDEQLALPGQEEQIPDLIPEPAAPPAQEKKPGISVTLPLIGQVMLEPTPADAQEQGMTAKLADKDKKLTLGALVLDDATLFMGSDNKLKLTARGTLLGKSVRVGMLEHTEKRTILGVDFEKSLSFHVLPGKEVSLNKLEVKLEKDKPVEMRSKVTIFNKPVEMYMRPTKEALGVTMKIGESTLSDIIPQAKGTPVNDVVLKDISMTVENLMSKTGKPHAQMTATADLSKVLEGTVSGDTAAVASKTTVAGTGEVTFEATLSSAQLPGFGTMKEAKFTADMVPKKGTVVTLSSKMDIDIPQAGKLPVNITAKLSSEGAKITGEVESGISLYDGKVTIEKAKISINTKKETFSLQGDTEAFGHKAVATISKSADGVKVDIALTEQTLYPFEKVPGLKDVGFSDVHFNVGTKGASLMGTVNIFNAKLAGELEIKETGGKQVYRLVAKMPSLPDKLKGTFLEATKPTDLYVALVSSDYVDPDKQMTYKAGINIGGVLHLTGPLQEIGTLSGDSEPQEFMVVLPENPMNLAVNIRIPKETPISKNCKFKSLIFTVGGGIPPEIKLAGTILFKPTPEDKEMIFTIVGEMTAVPTPGFTIEASYEGDWVDALGIKGFTLQKLGFGLGAQIVPAPEPIVPGMIEFAAAMILSKRELEVAMKGDIVKEKYGAYGKLRPTEEQLKAGHKAALSLSDLVSWAADLIKQKIDASKIPRLELQNFELRAAPQAFDIAGLHYDAGFLFKTEFNILGLQAHVDFHTMDYGLQGIGYLDKLESGPLSIVGTSTTGGPKIEFELSPTNPHFQMNGEVRIGNVFKERTDIEISTEKISFETEQLFQLDNSKLRMYTKALAPFQNAPPDFYLKTSFENTLYDWVYRKMKEPLDAAAQDAERRFNDAIQKVNDLNKEIESTKQAIADRQRGIKERQDWINAV
jgi:hypothetical protein